MVNRPGVPPGALQFGSEDEPRSGAQPVLVSRFVRETLEAYASETVADDVLRSALAMARWDRLPTGHEDLVQLIDVHLPAAVAATLGAELAEAVRERLRPLLAIVAQMERTSEAPKSERPTLVGGRRQDDDGRAPTRELELKPFPVVLVAGRDPSVATEVKRYLDARTAVIPVDAGVLLVRDLRLLRQQARMLIVDFRQPHGLLDAVRAEPALLEGAVVVLWGGRRERDAEIKQTFPGASVIRCGPEASVQDLAAIARMGPAR